MLRTAEASPTVAIGQAYLALQLGQPQTTETPESHDRVHPLADVLVQPSGSQESPGSMPLASARLGNGSSEELVLLHMLLL